MKAADHNPFSRGYTEVMAQAPALPRGFELPLEPRLPRIGSVDAVALEERAATLAKRSIKKESKLQAFELAVRMMDLTTLEGADTPGKVAALCSKALRPDPVDPSVPPVAAVCVYPNLVPVAAARLRGSSVKVASVATAFPAGQSPLPVKLADVHEAVELGADEVDMVIDRGAFLSGRYAKVYDEIVKVKEACGPPGRAVHLKVILETGELGTYDNVRRASLLAMAAGADFIKTSTGKVNPAATLEVTLCMLEAIRDVHEETGRMVGMKPAGGIRTAKQAVQYLVVLHETLGLPWLTPDLFRFGASSLLNDVLMQIRKQKTGQYQSPDYFTLD
jgi:deoxyribose-phosphate aldolase